MPMTFKSLPGLLLRRLDAMPPNARGALLVLGACVMFQLLNVQVRFLGQNFSVFEISFFRSFFSLAALVPIVAVNGGFSSIVPRYPRLHFSRAVTGAGAMVTGFYAVAHLPLAMATTISFAKPLFMIPMAIVILAEVVRWRRWAATLVGFAGVLVVVRPFDPASLNLAALVALMQPVLIAASMILIKSMPKGERSLTVVTMFLFLSTLFLAVPAAVDWRTPSLHEWGILVGTGLTGMFGQLFVTAGYRAGEASVMGTVEYSSLVLACALGYYLFSEIPDVWTILGAALIVASTAYITRREAQVGRLPKHAEMPLEASPGSAAE